MMSSTTNGSHSNNKVNTVKKRDQFKYGNYRNYYFKRLGANEANSDFRVELLKEHPELFRDKAVLDIGCNSGFVTISIAKKLLPTTMVAVDIDGGLIEQARRDLEKAKTEESLSERQREALGHLVFKKANFILKDESLLKYEKPQYDCILCLSVTKWIHLNYGDDGIKFMFKRIFKQLNPKGVLVLEAQHFGTYKKRCKISPEISKHYKSIQLKPENFEAYLLSDEVGFADSWCIADKEIIKSSGVAKGFHRPLQMFMKA